jgi:acetylornithine deacetylase
LSDNGTRGGRTGAAEQRVHDAIDALVPAYRNWLQALVRIPSTIGEEARAQDEVARAMRSVGLPTDVFDIDPDALANVPGFTAPRRSYANRPCVVGTLKGSGGGRSIALNAHIDTAPIDPAGAWTHPPYSGHIEGNLLYGRGAWDDKAGVAESLLVCEALRRSGVALRGDVVVQIVVEDEATGNGTLACLSRGHHTDGAIIVDGTWPERFIVSHMGQLWFTVALEGRSAPASVASRGANPLAAVGPLMRRLDAFVRARNANVQAWGNNTSPSFINVGHVQCGAWPGAVPSGCVLHGQFGFVPPDTLATARQALSEAVISAASESDWPADIRASIAFDGLETPVVVGDASNAVVRSLAATLHRLHGAVIQESVISGHCDLRHFMNNPWRPAIPACLYGPGGGRNAHSENEYFDLDHLPVVARTLASVVLEWCS